MATQADTQEATATNQVTVVSKVAKRTCTTKEVGNSLHQDLSIITKGV